MEVTLNDADKVPLESEQVEVPTGMPDNEQLVSPLEKYDPVTLTVAPICADAGLKFIDGGGTVTLADVESPAGFPVTVTL
jgi:hypothetical protein